jgi:hypothetical protein
MRVGKNTLPRVQRLALKVSPTDAGVVDMLSSQVLEAAVPSYFTAESTTRQIIRAYREK